MNTQPLFSQPKENELKIGLYVCIDISLNTVDMRNARGQSHLEEFLRSIYKKWRFHKSWKMGVILFADRVWALDDSMRSISNPGSGEIDDGPKQILEKIRQKQSEVFLRQQIEKTDFTELCNVLALPDNDGRLNRLLQYDQFDRNLFLIYTDGIPDPKGENVEAKITISTCMDFISKLDEALLRRKASDNLARVCMVLAPTFYKSRSNGARDYQSTVADVWQAKNKQSFRFQVFSVDPPSDGNLKSFDKGEQWVADWIGTKLSIAPLGLWEGNEKKILKLRLGNKTIPSGNDIRALLDNRSLEIKGLLLGHKGDTLQLKEPGTPRAQVDFLNPKNEYQFIVDNPGVLDKMFTQYWSYAIEGENKEKLTHFLGAREIKIPLVNLDGLTIMLQDYESDIVKLEPARPNSNYNYFQKLTIKQNPNYDQEFPIFIKVSNQHGNGIAEPDSFIIPLWGQPLGQSPAGIGLKLKDLRFDKGQPLLVSPKIEVADSTASIWVESDKKMLWRPFEILDQPWLYVEHELGTIYYFNWPLYEKCVMYVVIGAGLLLAVFFIKFASEYGQPKSPNDALPVWLRNLRFDPREVRHKNLLLIIWFTFFGATIFIDGKLYSEISNYSQNISLKEFIALYLPLRQYIYFMAVKWIIYVFFITAPNRFPQEPNRRMRYIFLYPLIAGIAGTFVATIFDIKLMSNIVQVLGEVSAWIKLGENQSS